MSAWVSRGPRASTSTGGIPSPAPLGVGIRFRPVVILATACIHSSGKVSRRGRTASARTWIPACAGMTGTGRSAERWARPHTNQRHSAKAEIHFSGKTNRCGCPALRADTDSSLRWNDGDRSIGGMMGAPAYPHRHSGEGRNPLTREARAGGIPAGHFFAIHLDRSMAQGPAGLIHMFVRESSTRLVENLKPQFHGRETVWSFFRQPA